MSDSVLKLNSVTIEFGGLVAVSDLNLEVKEGTIFGIIGPNGAGKTTVFNMLTGVYKPSSGTINAFGKKINGLKQYEIAHSGISRTFQNIRLFKNLSVARNVITALDNNPAILKSPFLSTIFRTKSFCRSESEKSEKALEILSILGLDSKKDTLTRNLPYGDQRRVEIARAIATGAKIILLDEPAAGMTSSETENLMATISAIRDKFHLTIVLIEHDMEFVMNICERIAVLDYGKKIAEGSATQIQHNPQVIEAYLGKRKKS